LIHHRKKKQRLPRLSTIDALNANQKTQGHARLIGSLDGRLGLINQVWGKLGCSGAEIA
jgi:hypothetical protein